MKRLQQSRDAAAGLVSHTTEVSPLTSNAPGRPQLHQLSVEHAAIIQKLSEREMSLLVILSVSTSTRDIARRLSLSASTVETYVRDLKKKLTPPRAKRMTRLELALLGYEIRKHLAYGNAN